MYLNPREKRMIRRKQLLFNIILTLQCFGMVFGAIYYYHKNKTHTSLSFLNIVGIMISVPSFSLWVLARFQLGQSFSYLPEANALVKTGLYSIFSHPIYIFSGLSVFGYLLLLGDRTWLAIFVLLLPVQWLRARLEDKVLAESFGREYEIYRQTVLF